MNHPRKERLLQMNEVTIDLSDLFHTLAKKWKWILCCALCCAALLDFYGYKRAQQSWERAKLDHEAYAATAEELPGYYTEEMYRLRGELTDEAATLAESYARVYRSFLARYGEEAVQPGEDAQLDAYMSFLDSLKDVFSVMGGAQREYFQHLISIDAGAEGEARHASVEAFAEEPPSVLQPKWIVIGLLAGLAGASLVIVLPYLMTKKLRTPRDLPLAFAVPILAEGKEIDGKAMAAGLATLGIKLGIQSILLLGDGGTEAAMLRAQIRANWPTGSRSLHSADQWTVAELPEKLAQAEAAVLVEQTGKSTYRAIEKEVELSRAYGVRLLGCIVLDGVKER